MSTFKANLNELLTKRDEYIIGSKEWEFLNRQKAQVLECAKSSTKEEIIYFLKEDLHDIQEGIHELEEVQNIRYSVAKRSLLEYHPAQRHPIPYIVVKHREYYFIILRGEGVGEVRLTGKKGCLGGHVGSQDIDAQSLSQTIENAMRRELEEEAGITSKMIESVKLKGSIKSNEGVDADHLGFSLLY